MSHRLIGDPASLSALAASLRRTALQLRNDAEQMAPALEDSAPGWTGPVAMTTRRRTAAVIDSLESVADALDSCARSLQRAATDLASSAADLRAIEEQAATAGFEVREGRLMRAWGITGVADGSAEHDGDRLREGLQDRLHQLLTTMGRQRSRLAADCRDATLLLTEASSALRA